MRINVYACLECGLELITRDADEGVTPFALPCDGCAHVMYSSFYRVPQSLTPTHEWYKPDDLSELDDFTQEHVKLGGLVLREIEK